MTLHVNRSRYGYDNLVYQIFNIAISDITNARSSDTQRLNAAKFLLSDDALYWLDWTGIEPDCYLVWAKKFCEKLTI